MAGSPCPVREPGDAANRTVERLRAAGHSGERITADVVLDAATIDRQKAAVRLGLLDTSDHDATRSWVRAELLHAIRFGRSWAGLDAADLRAEFEAAIKEIEGGRG